jgi:WD40 repeat protein/serine/threonine protein kinase
MAATITCTACQALNEIDSPAARDHGPAVALGTCVRCGHALLSTSHPLSDTVPASESVDILIIGDSVAEAASSHEDSRHGDAAARTPQNATPLPDRNQTIHMGDHGPTPTPRVTISSAQSPDALQAAALIATGGVTVTNKFTIVEELNRGGMGVVLRGRDKGLHREVAIKVIRDQDNQHQRSRFIKEAQITGQLEHPNIVPVHEFGLDESGRMFFAMKLVRGRNLAEVLEDHRVDPERAMREFPLFKMVGILVQVCNAIAFAHSRGVIHRDLKPSNIMLGDFGEVMLMDWGLAKVGDPAAIGTQRATDRHVAPTGEESTRATVGRFEDTVDGAVIGTPAYMPPEQAAGMISQMDARSDVYALGAILYEILTLEPPISGHDLKDVLRKAMMGAIVTPSVRASDRVIPKDLEAIAMKALDTSPDSRYPGASLMRADLENFLEGRAVTARADSVLEALGKVVRRHRITSTAVACAAVLLLAVLVGSYLVNLRQRERAEDERAVALIERSRAQSESDKAKHESARAEAAAASAEQERLRATRESTTALIERKRAEQALQVADQQRTVAEEERRQSTTAFERESRQREQSDIQNHLASLALAGEQIGHHEFSAARASLEGCPAHYRDWVWRRLSLLCRQQLALFADHTDAVTAVATSADGLRLVSVGSDGSAMAYDLAARRRIAQITLQAAAIRAVALSADGTRVLTGGDDGSLRLWTIGATDAVQVLCGSGPQVRCVAFAHPGGVLADRSSGGRVSGDQDLVIAGANDGSVRAWDAASGRERGTIGQLSEPVHALAVIAQGARVLVGGDAGEVVCWDLVSGTRAASARFGGAVLALDDHGPQALVAGPHGSAVVWDLARHTPLATLDGHSRDITCAAFSESGAHVATGSQDSDARVWDIAAGTCVVTLSGHGGAIDGVCFAHGDSEVLTASDDATVRLWDGQHRRDIVELTVPSGLSSLTLSPDGSHVIAGGSDGHALLWDLAGLAAPLTLAHGAAITSTAYAHDGRSVATAGAAGLCRIWDAQTGAQRCAMAGSSSGLLCVVFSPDGTECVTVSSDGLARIWSTGDGHLLGVCTGHAGAIYAAAYAPDGRVIATAGADATIRTYQAHTGTPRLVIPVHNSAVVAIAFSPDGRHLLSASDRIAEVWDADSGEKTQSLRGHTGAVLHVAYGSDGSQALTASSDGSARIWDIASGRPLMVLREHRAPVVAIQPAPNDRDMISADRSGRIIIWSAGDP